MYVIWMCVHVIWVYVCICTYTYPHAHIPVYIYIHNINIHRKWYLRHDSDFDLVDDWVVVSVCRGEGNSSYRISSATTTACTQGKIKMFTFVYWIEITKFRNKICLDISFCSRRLLKKGFHCQKIGEFVHFVWSYELTLHSSPHQDLSFATPVFFLTSHR